MRTRVTLLSVVLLVVFVTGLAFSVVQAQDESMTHVCDSTLISLLYIAEHDYGYEPMMDVSTFEKGQYAPLFDAMMAMMMEEEGEMMEATEEAMMEEGEMMMEGDMVMLTPGNIEGEGPACTELRASLDDFLYKALSEEMMMMEESGS